MAASTRAGSRPWSGSFARARRARFAGIALVGIEVAGGETGSEFEEFFALALDHLVGVEARGDEQADEVEGAEALAEVVALSATRR